MLILVCGLIASGKTTVAKRIHDNIGGVLLETNVIRNRIYPEPTHSQEEISHVYNLFFEEVRRNLEYGKNIVLDATFSSARNRNMVLDIAKEKDVDIYVIEVVCSSEEEVKRRIGERRDSIVKTDYNEYLKIKDSFDAIEDEKIIISNDGSLGELYEQVDGILTEI